MALVETDARANNGRRPLLRRRHDRLLALLDASADAVLGVDARGRITLVNEATTRMLGWSREELLGEQGDMIIPELSVRLEALRQRVRSVRRAGPSGPGVDLVARARNGLGIPVTLWLTPLTSRRPAAAVATMRDLRVSLAAEDLVARLEHERNAERAVTSAVLGSVNDRIVLVTDPRGCITRTNRAAERILGYSGNELTGTALRALSPPEEISAEAEALGLPTSGGGAGERALPDPLIELARCGLPSRQDRHLLTKDGRQRRVNIAVTPVTSLPGRESAGGFVCVVSERGHELFTPAVEAHPPVPRSPVPPVVIDVGSGSLAAHGHHAR